MKSISFFVMAVAGLVVAAGCVSNDKVVAVTDPTQKVCSVEYKTGSNMPVKQCHEPTSDVEREIMLRDARQTTRQAPGYKP